MVKRPIDEITEKFGLPPFTAEQARYLDDLCYGVPDDAEWFDCPFCGEKVPNRAGLLYYEMHATQNRDKHPQLGLMCHGYDSYDSHVVIADTPEEARKSVPIADEGDIWSDPKMSTCVKIGESNKKKDCVLSSFNAG